MAASGYRMPSNPHIVGGIEESGIDTLLVADDPLQKFGIAAVATSNAVVSENPDITRLRSGCRRNGRDDLVVRVAGRGENHIDLAVRESGQIDVDIERSEFAQFQLQDFQVPAGIERYLVVSDSECSLLDLRETGQDDGGNLGKPHRTRGLKPAMTRDNMVFGINENGIGESERFD